LGANGLRDCRPVLFMMCVCFVLSFLFFKKKEC